MSFNSKKTLISFIFCWTIVAAVAQPISFFNTIVQDSVPDFYLKMEWRAMERKKNDKSYRPATVMVITSTRDSLVIPAKIKTRGFRRLEICSNPPLKLKFDKTELAKHSLSPLNEMDIVHRCHDPEPYDQYLLREYLAYRLWELISPYHFKTKLVRLHYQNEDSSEAHSSSYAIIVEDIEELAERLGGRRMKTPIISKNAVDKEALLKVALFQFMIGNTDWLYLNRHNTQFVSVPACPMLITLPYDFDYSGLVGATYASHHESLNLPSISIRYYQGWCHTREEVIEALKVFIEQKESILTMATRIHGLSERSVKHTTSYLQEFYDIIENPRKLENQIIRHCNMWPVQK